MSTKRFLIVEKKLKSNFQKWFTKWGSAELCPLRLHCGCELSCNPSTPSHVTHELNSWFLQFIHEKQLSRVDMGNLTISLLSRKTVQIRSLVWHHSCCNAVSAPSEISSSLKILTGICQNYLYIEDSFSSFWGYTKEI